METTTEPFSLEETYSLVMKISITVPLPVPSRALSLVLLTLLWEKVLPVLPSRLMVQVYLLESARVSPTVLNSSLPVTSPFTM